MKKCISALDCNPIFHFSMSTMNMNSSTSSLNSLSGSRIGRQFRNLQSKSATTHRLVSAWNGLRELVGYSYRGNITPVNSGLPVHTAWSQYDLSLAVGGDARYKYTAIVLLALVDNLIYYSYFLYTICHCIFLSSDT